MSDFVMPSLGASMESGVLVARRKQVGEHVGRGDIIAEIETDKGIIEVEAFQPGTVERWLVAEGAKVPVGTALAVLTDEPPSGVELSPGSATETSPEPASSEPVEKRFHASPSARRLARELGVDLARIAGTGPGGAITRNDIARASPAAVPSDTEQTIAGMRQAVARAVSLSKREIPHYYLTHTLDVGPALTWLQAQNSAFPPAERILSSAVLLAAVARSLRDFPELNGHFTGGRFVPSSRVHVAMVIALRGGGIVAPAVRDADRLSVADLMASLRDVTQRARAGALRSSELSEGTITVTNLGDRGVESVLGVIYPPQVALVGCGRIAPRPWVVDGQVVPRPVLHVSLSADHRVSDGHRGALFLASIEACLGQPAQLLSDGRG